MLEMMLGTACVHVSECARMWSVSISNAGGERNVSLVKNQVRHTSVELLGKLDIVSSNLGTQ